MGNICRSPMAEGVFRAMLEKAHLSNEIRVDSVGTHAYHVGEKPDTRAQSTMREHGMDISMLRARRVDWVDFEKFDHILVMDDANFGLVAQACPKAHRSKIKYFLDFARNVNTRNVPDPYYGGNNGFERVFDMIEDAATGLLDTLNPEKRTGKSLSPGLAKESSSTPHPK